MRTHAHEQHPKQDGEVEKNEALVMVSFGVLEKHIDGLEKKERVVAAAAAAETR